MYCYNSKQADLHAHALSAIQAFESMLTKSIDEQAEDIISDIKSTRYAEIIEFINNDKTLYKQHDNLVQQIINTSCPALLIELSAKLRVVIKDAAIRMIENS